jgi:glyoxylase-like metal-dependent hydrolase (beta-lactamase superfamily II)
VELEDHLGDIVRKGRLQAGVSVSAAARAAGLTAAELAALEDNGIPPRRPDYPALAALLGLHAGKLEDICNGWRPAPVDLCAWRELRQITTFGQAYAANCYLAWDSVTKEAALFDTGFDPAPVCALVEENRLQLKHLFITHNHGDHAGALPAIAARFPNARLHTYPGLARPEQQQSPSGFITLGHLCIALRATPGHTEDGTTFIVTNWPVTAMPEPGRSRRKEALTNGGPGGAQRAASQEALPSASTLQGVPFSPHATASTPNVPRSPGGMPQLTLRLTPPPVAIVGDALFAGSMGNVPGPGAPAREIIREQILSLPPATLLCPGHGPLTTVAEELARNPFF